jgi:hypothetical protein
VERPIDVLFYGTVTAPLPEDRFFRQHHFEDRAIQDALSAAMRAVLSGTEDPYTAVKARLAALGASDDIVRIADIARLVDARVRAVRRWTLLSGLADLKVHFCGNVADDFRGANPNGVYLGAKSFSDVMDLVRRSKIVLNDTINLRQGMLMRPCYAAAEGCVLALESNAWFHSAFADGHNAILLEPGAPHAEKLRASLAAMDHLQSIADAGRVAQANAHQWDHRIGPLVEKVASPNRP